MIMREASAKAPATGEVALSAGDRLRYEAVFAPTPVGVPPTYAHRALTATASGEVRHYGWTSVTGVRHRSYVRSDNFGLDWKLELTDDPGELGPMVKCPWADYWLGFEHSTGPDAGIVLPGWSSKNENEIVAVRSRSGPGTRGCETFSCVFEDATRRFGCQMRNPIPLPSRRRWLAVANLYAKCPGPREDLQRWMKEFQLFVGVAYSDDDGRTWTTKTVEPNLRLPGILRDMGDQGPRAENFVCEGSAIELGDGTVLMAVRTSLGHHWLYRSADGGETWSRPGKMPMFHSVGTMPLFHRLADGRLLFIWNNTEPMPELDLATEPGLFDHERTGLAEDVFTNRDVLHAAISDDGQTWRGFRELYLNPVRERADFRSLGNAPDDEADKSVHQTQALNLPDGKVLLALGQNPCARRIILFDPGWLLETSRREEFRREALARLSTHLYVKSISGCRVFAWSGHCAWNRTFGALLVPDPDPEGPEAHEWRESLQLCRIHDPRLFNDRQGVVWNFPAAARGRVEIVCTAKGAGFLLSLCDRWVNPSDPCIGLKSIVMTKIDSTLLGTGWRRLMASWGDGVVTLAVDGNDVRALTCEIPPWGLSYLHLQTAAEKEDFEGTLFRLFDMRAADDE